MGGAELDTWSRGRILTRWQSYLSMVRERELEIPMQKEHHSYDIKYNLRAVASAKKTTITAAARELGVDRKRIRQWLSHESDLVQKESVGVSA